jgi:hypothetical protein
MKNAYKILMIQNEIIDTYNDIAVFNNLAKMGIEKANENKNLLYKKIEKLQKEIQQLKKI